jgi:hypothetical protein
LTAPRKQATLRQLRRRDARRIPRLTSSADGDGPMSKNPRRHAVLAFASVLIGVATAVADTPPIPAIEPLVLNGIEYRAEHEFRAEGGNPAALHAGIEARDVKTGRTLWWTTAYTISTNTLAHIKGQNVPNDPMKSLAPFADGVLITTQAGAILFLDPKTKSAEAVRDRRCKSAECEVHHRPLKGELVKIHYGIVAPPPAHPPVDARDLPHAWNTPISAGCCVMERYAACFYCEECRKRAPKSSISGFILAN